MWPLFQSLNIDNILTICEVCISHLDQRACVLTRRVLRSPARSRTNRACSVPLATPCDAWGTFPFLHLVPPM